MWSTPFSRQMRSNRTSTGGWAKRPVKTWPLSVRTWAGTPYSRSAEQKPSHTDCVRSPEHEPSRHAEPRVVVEAGQRLGGRAVSEREPVHQVQLPKLHRCG